MFKRSKLISSSSGLELNRFIESIDNLSDVANSRLLQLIDQCEVRNLYTIEKYENRIDLIAQDIYGSESYSWLLMYMNRITSLDELVRLRTLEYIPITNLKEIITQL